MSSEEVNLDVQLETEAYKDKSLCELEEMAEVFASDLERIIRSIVRLGDIDTQRLLGVQIRPDSVSVQVNGIHKGSLSLLLGIRIPPEIEKELLAIVSGVVVNLATAAMCAIAKKVGGSGRAKANPGDVWVPVAFGSPVNATAELLKDPQLQAAYSRIEKALAAGTTTVRVCTGSLKVAK